MVTGSPTAAFTRPETKYRLLLVDGNMEPRSFLSVQVVCKFLVSFWHQIHASYCHITGGIYVDMNVTHYIDSQSENEWLKKLILVLL